MNTKKRIAVSLSIFAVLMIVTAVVTLIYVQQQNASFDAALYGGSTTTYGSSYSLRSSSTAGYNGASSTNGGGSCFGCVTITDLSMNVVNSNMPSECYIPSWDSGSQGMVIEPNGARTFTYEFHINTAYGVQSDGVDCSNNDDVSNLYIQNSNLVPISIQSVSPSLPYNVLNIGDGGGEQNFVITFYVLQGNSYNGALALTLQISGD